MELQEKLKHYRINEEEYALIGKLLGRPPEGLEWALFSALWSEHCSYKSSRVHLKGLFNKSDRVLESFGENAGVVDLGKGERVAFKMESHNHPSYIEPYQGAATGVGGILRDIFTMGARPMALANYLCFGQPKADRMESLVDGVVRGIGGYGNCVGVPNVTGQTEFDSSYDGNILVNAFALGYFGAEMPIALSGAKGPGNYVVYVGAKTGKDGVHGASMASESFDDDSESKKPNVQIGDPFFEKCLIESCLEVIKAGLVESIQDMGAAGLTSSSFEMASKGQVGLRMHLDKVPVRDSSITPEEILLSESQERMLLICLPEKFEELQEVFHRWQLDATVIGEVLPDRVIELYDKGELLTSIDPDMLVENAPAHHRKYNDWVAKNRVSSDELPRFTGTKKEYLEKSMQDIRTASRDWIYRQYDQRVGGRTERDCSDSVGVVRLPSDRRLGMVLGCRPYVMQFDAYVGGVDSVAYPSLQLAAKGFEPLAMTDCLNFGNPEKEEIMSEFVAALAGMNKMAEAVVAPIISGNVSFYNETLGENITSTPSTGIVGLREDAREMAKCQFVSNAEDVLRVHVPQVSLGDRFSESTVRGNGEMDVHRVAEFIKAVRELSLSGSPSSSRVVGKFGILQSLSRMCSETVGVEISEDLGEISHEKMYEVIFSFADKDKTQALVEKLFSDFEWQWIGRTNESGTIDIAGESIAINSLQKMNKNSWTEHFNGLA